MEEKEYLVATQILFVEERHYQAMMNNKLFFTIFPSPARPTSLWGRLAGLRRQRYQTAGPDRFRVTVPLYRTQNLRRSRRRITVRVFMVDSRMDIAYDPHSAFFAGTEAESQNELSPSIG